MPKLETIFDDLAGSDSPIEWAMENLTLVGRGSAAYVFEHPDDPSFVLRVSDYPDGWFAYAEDSLSIAESETPSRHRPRVSAIRVIDGVFAAVAERLDEIEEGSFLSDVREVVIAAIHYRREPSEADDLIPGFMGFVSELNARLDARPENFMRRGDDLVFNDPYSALTFERERRIREDYAYPPSTSEITQPVRRCLP